MLRETLIYSEFPTVQGGTVKIDWEFWGDNT